MKGEQTGRHLSRAVRGAFIEEVLFEQAVEAMSKNLLWSKRRKAFQKEQFKCEKAY